MKNNGTYRVQGDIIQVDAIILPSLHIDPDHACTGKTLPGVAVG